MVNYGSMTATLSSSGRMSGTLGNNRERMSASLRSTGIVVEKDYEKLDNLPKINHVTLIGDKSSEDLQFIVSKTTEEWASTPTAMSFPNTIYVYTDYKEIGPNQYAPGFKIGDGTTYVADLPFVTAEDARITQADIDKWNDAARVTVDEEHHRLVFY